MKLPIYRIEVRYTIKKHKVDINKSEIIFVHSPVKSDFHKNVFTAKQIHDKVGRRIQGKNVKMPKYRILGTTLISEHGETNNRFTEADVCPLLS